DGEADVDELAIAAAAAEEGAHGLAVEELHADIKDAFVGAGDVVDGDDVVVAQAAGHLGLAEEVLLPDGGAEEPGMHELEGDLLVHEGVEGPVNDAHAAFSDTFLDFVAAGDPITPREVQVNLLRGVGEL